MTFRITELRWQVSPEFTLAVPSLTLPAERTTAILGRSASGKSTLLSLLGRVEGSYFERPESLSGSIVFDELELLALSERELLQRKLRGQTIGFVFQREGLFPGRSARDNITWPLTALGLSPSEAAARADQALADVGLPADKNVATLSGGERKRLAIARAIAPSPRVLLLDEPLTGLDPEALQGLRDLLQRLASGRTLVMVTHQREDVEQLADHLVFMDHGRVTRAGPRAELGDTLTRFFAGQAITDSHPEVP